MNGSSEKSDLDFCVAAGLEFSNDEDVLDLHIDSDDEMRSSFPKDTRPKTLILGGPQPPDPTGVPEDEYRRLYSVFRKKRKAFTLGVVNKCSASLSVIFEWEETFGVIRELVFFKCDALCARARGYG